jgi:hypothetical protein
MINDCFTQNDCPAPLVCYIGPNSTRHGECLDARFIPNPNSETGNQLTPASAC